MHDASVIEDQYSRAVVRRRGIVTVDEQFYLFDEHLSDPPKSGTSNST